MLKVAMIVRSTFYTVPGGDTVQVLQTAAHFGQYGVTGDILPSNSKIDYHQYDLLHFFNITRPADILFHIKKSRIPFLVSTILVDYSEYDKHYRKGYSGFLLKLFNADGIEYLKTIARWLKGKDKLISASYLWKGQRRSIKEVLRNTAMALPNSSSEYERLKKRYHYQNGYKVVPNGIDTKLFTHEQDIQRDAQLVLCVARIEGIKNQLNLILALNNTAYRLVLIGAPAPNQMAYYKYCRQLAAVNVTFINHLPQQELVQWYQRANVHVLPSWFETTGLSSLEAAVMGCSIVITDKGDTREYFGDDACYCNPSSPDSIYTAVKKAATLPRNEQLRKKILACYRWDQATRRTVEAYEYVKNVWH